MDIEIPMTPEVLKDELRLICNVLTQHIYLLTSLIDDLAIDYEIDESDLTQIKHTLAWLAGHAKDGFAFPSERYLQ